MFIYGFEQIECAGIQQYADVNRSSDAVSPDECGGMDQVADRNSYCETAGGTCVSVTIQWKSIDASITAPAVPACCSQHNPGFLFRLPSLGVSNAHFVRLIA